MSFDVPEGRIVGIVGESGCGKSTLINAVLGLLADNGRISGGSIAFEGRDLTSLQPREMQALRGPRIATVFQDPMGALNPVLAIGRQMRNIQYRAELSNSDKDRRSAEMLARVRIPDSADALSRYPHDFSGGMKRRIKLACGVMHAPKILLLDEPTVGVDPQSRERIYTMIDSLSAEGCSVLLTTHHMEEAEGQCERLVILDRGQIVADGTIDVLTDQAVGSSRYVRLRIHLQSGCIPGDLLSSLERWEM